MGDDSIRRRQLLAGSLTAGLAGTAGCVKQRPEATHWEAGIRWSDPPGTFVVERGFGSKHGSVFTGPAYATDYVRVNGGELREVDPESADDSIPAGPGDHLEYVVDFDGWFHGEETVFEYTIPDDDLVGVVAGFAECLRYRGTDGWVIRPLNVDLSTDLFGRQNETLRVTVQREYADESPDWYVWGHTESIRDEFRDRASERNDEYGIEPDIEFLDPDAEATFSPAGFYQVGMKIFDGTDQIAWMWYSDPHAEL